MWPTFFTERPGVDSLLRGRATPLFRRWPVVPLLPLLALVLGRSRGVAGVLRQPSLLVPRGTPWGEVFGGWPWVGPDFYILGLFIWPVRSGAFSVRRRALPGSSGLGFLWLLGLRGMLVALVLGLFSKLQKSFSVYVRRSLVGDVVIFYVRSDVGQSHAHKSFMSVEMSGSRLRAIPAFLSSDCSGLRTTFNF